MYRFVFIFILVFLYCPQGQSQDKDRNTLIEIRACEQKVKTNLTLVYDSILYYAKKQHSLAEELGDSIEIGKAYLSLGYANRNLEIFKEELQNFSTARRIFTEQEDPVLVATATLEIASLYKEARTTEYSPLEMLHFAARIFHMDGDSDHLLARCYMELGLNYRNDYQYNPETRDSIIYYYTLAKQYADQAGDFHISNEIKNDIADYYLLKPQINPDTVILLSSQVFQSTHSNLKNKAVAYLNAYLAKKIKGETDSLFHYLFTGYSLTNKIKPSRLQRQSAELLYQYYLDKEMYDSALFYFIKEKQTNIKLSSNYNYLSLLFDNKDKEAKIAEQQNVIISANLKRQQIFIYILIAGTILSLIFTAIIIRKNSVIKLKSHELQKKNDQIESLIKEIHHRVKNNLQMIVGLLDLQESSIKDTAVSLVLNDASSRIKSIALIHQKLYSGDTDMINIGFHHYMEELCDNLIYSYDLMDKIEVRLDIDEIETSFDRAVIFGLLTTELITNVLKHAFKGVENGYIELKVKKGTSHDLVLSVKDNGVGMSTDLNKKTDSFGLDLIQSFVSDLEGEIKFINNGGTTVEVKLAHFIYNTVD